MYCQSCGASVTENLSYCNRCGANLRPLVTVAKPSGLIWVIFVGLTLMALPFPAFIVIVQLMKELKSAGFPIEFIIAISVISLLTVFGAVLLLSRLLSPLVKTYLQSGEADKPSKLELSYKTPAQLEEAREPVSSVTENTTRIFEPVYREDNTR